ncbi:MAG: exodeoxyribonuclease VII large subunit [Chlamydiota bacterium]
MKILTVSELTQEIKRQLETNFRSISVKGEISNLKVQTSGHIYFTLKDKESQISAVLFKGSTKNLSRLPKEGDQIVALGELTVYSPRGSYQLLVREMQYQGVGELLTQLHERKNRLQALGYFSKERKRKLPAFPKTIGVITSPTGAVIQDIIHILQRRHSGFHLILHPVKVQGEGAKEEIAQAIYDFNHHNLADVLIVGRGGGSLEDLWAFNEEIVVEAIFRSKIPVISAVGHETDFSLSDFVADMRAPTPSAAAEIVLAEKNQQLQFILQAKTRINQSVLHLVSRLKKQISSLQKNPYLVSPYLLLSKRLQDLDDKKAQLTSSINSILSQKKMQLLALNKQKNALEPSYQIRMAREKLFTLQKAVETSLRQTFRLKKQSFDSLFMQKKLDSLLRSFLEKKKENLLKLTSHLTSIDPKSLLTKGYCILFSENRDSVILSSKQVSISQNLKILLKDGIISTEAKEIIYEST